MIHIIINSLTVTVITPVMEIVVPVSMWLNRDSRKSIIKIAQGE
jgi:hypothetical protein